MSSLLAPFPAPLRGLSSMATRRVLAELIERHNRVGGPVAELQALGGVDAARRIQEGEAFDWVVLASDAIERLRQAGRLHEGSVIDLVLSGVAVAVAAGAPHPDLRDEAALRAAVLAAPTVGYSTGPSGTALMALFARWGLTDALQGRLLRAPAGVPVGELVARGEVALGFQQHSELLHVPGIDCLGPLPAEIQITTTFSGAIPLACNDPARRAAAAALLAFMASPQAEDAKRREGMEPA